jgi:hypothetical protein
VNERVPHNVSPRKPLGGYPEIPNKHPLLEHRLATARMGYLQCAVREKQGGKGWSSVPCSEHDIKTRKEFRNLWFTGTGIRLSHDMTVADIDVSIAAIADEIRVMIESLDPAAWEQAIHRDSGAASSAHFFRCEPFTQHRTPRYTAHPEHLPAWKAACELPETNEAEHKHKKQVQHEINLLLEPQKFEIYGGLSKGRQFQYEGKHSEGRDYHCQKHAPWNTRREDLPLLAIGPGQLVDRVQEILAAHLTLIPEPETPGGEVVYDLTPETLFFPKNGPAGTVTELTEGLEWGGEQGIPGLLPGHVSIRENHCKLFVTSGGRICVIDWSKDNQVHYLESDRPPGPIDASLTLAPLLAAAGLTADTADTADTHDEQAPPRPAEENFDVAVVWMVDTFAHCKGDVVMPIWAVDATAAVPVNEFHHKYQMYKKQKKNRKGKRLEGFSYATRVWLGHEQRKTVDGFDMRPDMAFPLFTEDGRSYKNIYKPPRHTGDGEIETFVEFMHHLVPAENERELHLDSIAHKRIHPHIPGLATIMVAEGEPGSEQSGTGRGTYFKILERLFGWRYAKRVDWEIVTGTSPQATFTDWQADLALVFVEESKDVGNSKFTERRGVYEHLKTVIDNAPRRAVVRSKYGKPRDAMLNVTYLFATNHADAIQIPASDRRFLVISNGEQLPEQLAKRVHAWMDRASNIAALDRWLRARDISAYDPMAAPLMTDARERMIDLAISETDRLVAEAIRHMHGHAFTRSQVLNQVYLMAEDKGMFAGGVGLAQFNQVFRRSTVPLCMPGVRPKQERRFRIGSGHESRQERGYAKTQGWAKHLETWDHDAVRAEIEKSGEGEVARRKREDEERRKAFQVITNPTHQNLTQKVFIPKSPSESE